MPVKPIEPVPSTIQELVSSINILISGASKFRIFQRLYRNDRVAFVFDIMPVLAKTITDYQLEILGYFDEGHSRVAVRGPHGLGKTFLAATLVHHAVLTSEDDAKVITTASAWRQLEKYLWPEIKKVAKFINWTEVGRQPYDPRTEFFQDKIRLNDGLVEAFAVASDDHNTIEGAHASRLIYIFDEAKAIPRATWDAAEGAFAGAGLKVIKNSNETVPEQFEGISQSDMDGFLEDAPIYNKSLLENSYIGDIEGPLGSGIEESVSSYGYVDDVIVNGEEISSSKQQGLQHHASHTTHIPESSTSEFTSIFKEPIINSPTTSNCVEALAFAISTPGDPSGQFYDIHMKLPGFEDWKVRHVTLDEAIRAGRISRDWAIQRARQWGVDSAIYQNRVEGEFADVSDEGIIPLSWIRQAVTRWNDAYKNKFIGLLDSKKTNDTLP